mgnify:CR=1 FL=1
MIITCSASESYLGLLRSLLNSISINYPQCKVVARLINCSDKDNNLQTIHSDTEVIFDQTDASTVRNKLQKNGCVMQDQFFGVYADHKEGLKGAKWLYSDFIGYCTNNRYPMIQDLLVKGEEQILQLDVDVVVRRDLTLLQSLISKHDICLHAEIRKDRELSPFGITVTPDIVPILTRSEYLQKETNENQHWSNCVEWHTGVMGFNNTETTRKFVKRYIDELDKPENRYIFGAEEEEVYFLYLNEFSDMKLYSLPVKFKDEGQGDDAKTGAEQYRQSSYIWVGAGSSKYCCDEFIKEVQKYGSVNNMHV